MTKQGLVEIISTQNGITKKLSEEYINVVFEGIKEALKEEDKLSLQGIISFEVRTTKGRKGTMTNKDGEKIPYETSDGYKVVAKVSDVFQKEVLI